MSGAGTGRPGARGRFLADDCGGASIEFVIVFPLLMTMFLSAFEVGWLATRLMMLERGVDIAAREVRLGASTAMDHESLKTSICRHSNILANCQRDMILEVVEMEIDKPYPQNQANCRDRTGEIEPKIDFNAGGRERIMFMRACMIIDPIFPGIGLGLRLPKDASGGYQLIAYTAFMNEPA